MATHTPAGNRREAASAKPQLKRASEALNRAGTMAPVNTMVLSRPVAAIAAALSTRVSVPWMMTRCDSGAT